MKVTYFHFSDQPGAGAKEIDVRPNVKAAWFPESTTPDHRSNTEGITDVESETILVNRSNTEGITNVESETIIVNRIDGVAGIANRLCFHGRQPTRRSGNS
jgi:hypothetical protein